MVKFVHECVAKNPNFYKKTYWGAYPYDNETYNNKEILFARYEFMENMKKVRKASRKEEAQVNQIRHMYQLDHMEYYIGKDGKKYQVCSIYNSNGLRLTQEQMIKEGWVKIPSMFSTCSTTYMKLYDKYREDLRQKILDLFKSLHQNMEYIKPKIEKLEQLLGYKYSETLEFLKMNF